MSLWTWLGKIFHDVKIKVAPLVVGIIEAIKAGEDSGLIPAIAKVLAPITAGLSLAVNALVQNNINKYLAVALEVEGLPDNPTEDQEKAFSQTVAAAFMSKKLAASIKGKIEQDLAVQLYDIIVKTITADKAANVKVTANQIIIDIEEAYNDLQADIAAETATAGTTATPN